MQKGQPYDSCYEYAEALVRGEESPSRCKDGRDGLTEDLFTCVLEFQKLAEPPRYEKGKPPRKDVSLDE